MLLFIGLGRSNKGELLCCAGCGQRVALVDDLCRILDRPPRKTYTNPHGLLCSILTLARAEGLLADSVSSTEHTWFTCYAWRPVSCAGCGLFMGWAFEAEAEAGEEPDGFFGLLEQRLVSKPGEA